MLLNDKFQNPKLKRQLITKARKDENTKEDSPQSHGGRGGVRSKRKSASRSKATSKLVLCCRARSALNAFALRLSPLRGSLSELTDQLREGEQGEMDLGSLKIPCGARAPSASALGGVRVQRLQNQARLFLEFVKPRQKS